jgi:hypothetical protein
MKDEIYKTIGKTVKKAVDKSMKGGKESAVVRKKRQLANSKNVSKTQKMTAIRQDALKPAKDYLRSRGYSWSRFSKERLSVDPSLSKLESQERALRVAELWAELGPEEFARRFNV